MMFINNPFDKHAMEYDLFFERYPHVFYSELEAFLKLKPSAEVGIEIGAGTGRFASHLGITIGLEPSRAMAEIAESRGIKIIKAYAEKMPIEDEKFDFAVMATVICFLKDVPAALKEIHRIIKPNGSVLIGFIDKDSPLGRHYEKTKHHRKFLKKATFFSSKQVADFLIDAGFGALEFRQTLFKPLEQITDLEPVLEGCDKGSYIVIKGIKN